MRVVHPAALQVMLASEHIQPHRLGYDRPSPKLLGFLRKYYDLVQFVPQANNFVVFNNYFDESVNGATTKGAVVSRLVDI